MPIQLLKYILMSVIRQVGNILFFNGAGQEVCLMTDNQHQQFMSEAISLAGKNLHLLHGGPFGAVVVREGRIIGRGYNQVLLTSDPTAHAEIAAIRQACSSIGTFSLEGCILYSSCEPCPMCLGAIYWARLDALYYGCTRHDAAMIGFDDEIFYKEISRPESRRTLKTSRIMRDRAFEVFQEWEKLLEKPGY